MAKQGYAQAAGQSHDEISLGHSIFNIRNRLATRTA